MAVWQLVDVLCWLIAEAVDLVALVLTAFEGAGESFVQVLQFLLSDLPALLFKLAGNTSSVGHGVS